MRRIGNGFVRNVCLLVAVALLSSTVLVPRAKSCSVWPGNFYQVTYLRGKVVGSDAWIVESIEWMRQQLTYSSATLALYEYNGTWFGLDKRKPLKIVRTDRWGRFDFGNLQVGHYTLLISSAKGGLLDVFDIEIKGTHKPIDYELIDVSPYESDCSGGHQIIVSQQ